MPEAQRIASRGAQQARVDVDVQTQTLGLGHLAADVGDTVKDAGEMEVGLFQDELSGLDLGEVENVVDQAQQVLAREMNLLEAVALVLRSTAVERQVGQADDGVHRRADLVAHVRQEIALGMAGGLRQARGGLQRLRALQDARLERFIQAQQDIGCAPSLGYLAIDQDLPVQAAVDVKRRDVAFDVPVVGQFEQLASVTGVALAQGFRGLGAVMTRRPQLPLHEGEEIAARGRGKQVCRQAPHLDESPVHAADAAGLVGDQNAIGAGFERGGEQRGRARKPQVRLDAGTHNGDVDGLDDEVDGAQFEAERFAAGVVMRGHEDDGNVARQRVGLEPPTDLETVHARHHHVEQDQVGPLLQAHLQGIGATRRLENLVVGRERLVEQENVQRLVVDGEQDVTLPFGRGGGQLHGGVCGLSGIRPALTARPSRRPSRPAS